MTNGSQSWKACATSRLVLPDQLRNTFIADPPPSPASSLLTRAGAAGAGRSLAGVEIVPVHDRVEAKRVGALRLPAPERTDGEHDDVPLAERMVERSGAVREE